MADEARMRELFASGKRGVLVTIKRDGRPQMSNVFYVYDQEQGLIRVSVTADRAKAKNAARDPRVSLHVASPDFFTWAVAEGTAELTPVAQAPDDDTVAQLVDYYRAGVGEHPDWAEFRAAMVEERRQLLTLRVERFYGQTP
ncbi:PPOX class F420-dependent oxidoreductase [Kitasatospora acidiphila]|uniref:PPOX class F420-dependent oxidoreductase n=1 Tax=Kitasatospora acidiphila TaxID=2567942 RepID=A0A540VY43_9ACTN|nr:PPOX class F420-dependent oxidoreductase [Kitasatospora acidiphila]TQF01675.1 PPOX class F420-dependent oxidoreductase [Kitasatospora acidiphila]